MNCLGSYNHGKKAQSKQDAMHGLRCRHACLDPRSPWPCLPLLGGNQNLSLHFFPSFSSLQGVSYLLVHFHHHCRGKIQICPHSPPILLRGPASSHCDFCRQSTRLVWRWRYLISSLNCRGEESTSGPSTVWSSKKEDPPDGPESLARYLPGFPFLRKSVSSTEPLGKYQIIKFLSETQIHSFIHSFVL